MKMVGFKIYLRLKGQVFVPNNRRFNSQRLVDGKLCALLAGMSSLGIAVPLGIELVEVDGYLCVYLLAQPSQRDGVSTFQQAEDGCLVYLAMTQPPLWDGVSTDRARCFIARDWLFI
mmetsp:Transcript_10468/g.17050  ORF Transcript_10468/g.17050 Transcript_10468/m.17050 type:complete len:117 (+) Transcript_10468:1611-1961(+)